MSGDFVCKNRIKLPGEVDVLLYEANTSSLKVVIAQVASPVININVTIPTEAYTHEGEPHCLEHLIFRGSSKYPVAGYLDSLVALSLASGTNACTDTDKTYYTASMVGMEAFSRIMPVYLDHIYHPVLNEADFRTEVYHMDGDKPNGVVYSEMETYMSDPNFVGDYKLHEMAYLDTSKYHYNTGGIPDHITKLNNDKVKAMHSKLYKLHRSVISIIGQVDTEQVLSVISNFVKEQPQQQGDALSCQELTHPIPKSSKILQSYSAESSDEDVIVLLGFRCPNNWLDIEKRIGLEILLSYMTEGSSAPLVKWLIENPDESKNIASDLDVETHEYEHDLITFTFTDVLISDRKNQLLNRFKTVIQDLCNNQKGIDMTKIKSIIQREIRCEISDLQKNPHSTLEDRLTCWATMTHNPNSNQSLRDILCPDLILQNLLQRKDPKFWTDLLQDIFINNESYQVWMKPKVMKHHPSKDTPPQNHPPHSNQRTPFAITDLDRKRVLREMIGGVRGLGLKDDMSWMLPDCVDEGLMKVPSLVFDQKGRSDFVELCMMTDMPKDWSGMSLLSYLERLLKDSGMTLNESSMKVINFVRGEVEEMDKGWDENVVGSLKCVLRTFPVEMLVPIMTYIMESPSNVKLRRGDVHTEEILRLDKDIIIELNNEEEMIVEIDHMKWDKILTSYVLEFAVDEGLPGGHIEGSISYPLYKASLECNVRDFGHVLALMKGYLVGAEIDLDRLKIKVRKFISQLNSSIRTGESLVRPLNTLISFTDNNGSRTAAVSNDMTLNRDNIILLSILSRLVLAYPDLFIIMFEDMLRTLHRDRLLNSSNLICYLSIGNMSTMQNEVFNQIGIYFPNLITTPSPSPSTTTTTTKVNSFNDITSSIRPIVRRKDIIKLPLKMYLTLPNLETGHIELTCALPLVKELIPINCSNIDNQIYLNIELIEVITAYLQSEQGPIFQPVRDNGYSYCPTFYYDIDSQSITLRLFDSSQPHSALECAINSLSNILESAKKILSNDNDKIISNETNNNLTEQSFEVAKSSALHNIIRRYMMTPLKAMNHASNNWLRNLPLFRGLEILHKINQLTWNDFLRGLIIILDQLLKESNRQLIGIFPPHHDDDKNGQPILLYDKIGDLLIELTNYSTSAGELINVSKCISKLLRMKTSRLSGTDDSDSSDDNSDDSSDDNSD